jgi:hypothetical protein
MNSKKFVIRALFVSAAIFTIAVLGLYTYDWFRTLGRTKIKSVGADIYLKNE